MSLADVLRAAAAKVRRGWTQGEYARNAAGLPVVPASPRAVCWCAGGAIAVCAGSWSHRADVADVLVEDVGSVVAWNDATGRTAEEVATQMERTAARLDDRSAWTIAKVSK